jgi:hypothetical protein
MSISKINVSIPLCKPDSFCEWKEVAQAQLEHKGQWKYVDGSIYRLLAEEVADPSGRVDPNTKAVCRVSRRSLLSTTDLQSFLDGEEKCRGTLKLLCSNSPALKKFTKVQRPDEIWNILCNSMERKHNINKVSTMKKLMSTTCEDMDAEKVSQFMNSKKECFYKLERIGMPLPEECLPIFILAGLGSSFKPIVDEYVFRDTIKMEDLEDSIDIFLEARTLRVVPKEDHIKQGLLSTKIEIICTFCKKRNHSRENCHFDPDGPNFNRDRALRRLSAMEEHNSPNLQNYTRQLESAGITKTGSKRQRDSSQPQASVARKLLRVTLPSENTGGTLTIPSQ